MKMTKEEAQFFDNQFYEAILLMFRESGKKKYDFTADFVRVYFEDNQDLIRELGFGALKLFSYIITKQLVEDRKKAEADAVANAFSK